MSQFETGHLEIQQSQTERPDVTLFALNGPFTLTTMFHFQSILRDPETKGAIIEMSGVPYMDSAGLGVLLGFWAHTQRGGYKFAVAGMSSRVRVLFEITHTLTILPIFETADDAQQAFAA